MAQKKTVAGSTSIQKWDEELAKYATKTVETQKQAMGGGSFVQTASGRLSYKQAPIKDNVLDCVIVEDIFENAFYKGQYDPDNPAPPVCFAFGHDVATMVPHKDVTERQHPTCKGCPQAEFGTSATGKGKACKNIQRLALITEDSLANVKGAEVAYFKVPVTSMTSYAKYATDVAQNFKRPLFGVVTSITTEPHPKHQFHVLFEMKDQIMDGEQMGALVAKHKEQETEIAFPYVPMDPDRQTGKAKGGPRKFDKPVGGAAVKKGARR